MKKVTRKTANKVISILEHNAEGLAFEFLNDNKTISVKTFIELSEKAIKNSLKLIESAKNPIHKNNGYENFYIISDDSIEITARTHKECKEIVVNLEDKISTVTQILSKYR